VKRFGIKFLLISVFVALSYFLFINLSIQNYTAETMGPLEPFSRNVLSIVKGNYLGKEVPEKISEDKIIQLIKSRGQPFAGMTYFEKYDVAIYSKNKKIACVIWDPKTNRKLLEDVYSTKQPDSKAWEKELYGNDFTIGWNL
jgi:hypothetical protein